MNYVVAQLKVKRMELVQRQTVLRLKAKELASGICAHVNVALADSIEEMDLVSAANSMDELVLVQAELLAAASKIKEVEANLG